ncbi:MAG: beta-N-acetylhexosaminidase, partial [Lachnospiraceae bacterium]|nr:beta-N-acetylhexosaminidase [Lachnospiraceae bacterium]
YSSEEAAILALKAGCDMILCPENFEEAYQGVLKAVQDGTISEDRVNDSLRRVYRIKYADRVE